MFLQVNEQQSMQKHRQQRIGMLYCTWVGRVLQKLDAEVDWDVVRGGDLVHSCKLGGQKSMQKHRQHQVGMWLRQLRASLKQSTVGVGWDGVDRDVVGGGDLVGSCR
jgi:hypothetical protein